MHTVEREQQLKAVYPVGAAQVMERLRELGVLIGKGGLHGNVFRIKPPMCITPADAAFLTDALDLALSEL